MANNVKEHIIATLRSLMKPIIMILLRNGVTYKEFASLCKLLFVEAAAQDYGLRGRPTNISRIAVLTGIDRKEAKRLKDLLHENRAAQDAQNSQDRITRLLTAWYQDPEFTVQSGQPKPLSIVGESGSFSALARRFGGDVPVQALLKELLRVGVVAKTDGQVVVLSRYYFPAQHDPEALLRAGSVISDLGETLFHNLYVADDARPGTKKMRRFERRASNNLIDPRYQKAFHQFLDREGQAFLDRVDAWLSEHERHDAKSETARADSPADVVRLGVGVFAFDQPAGKTGD